jgi:hypothetical protein
MNRPLLAPSPVTAMTEQTESNSCSSCSSGWRLPLLLGIVLLAILLTQNRDVRQAFLKPFAAPPAHILPESPAEPAQQVLLSINFGNGQLQHETTKWRDGMTVADVLQQEPRISYETSGSGESGFLTALNGVANEGAKGRNWTYSVNGKYADRSFAVYELRPNDHVLWTFAAEQ